MKRTNCKDCGTEIYVDNGFSAADLLQLLCTNCGEVEQSEIDRVGMRFVMDTSFGGE